MFTTGDAAGLGWTAGALLVAASAKLTDTPKTSQFLDVLYTLKGQLGGIASGDNGPYTFTPTAVFEGNGHQLTHWEVTIEGATTYRGLHTDGKTLKTIGSTFHQFDAEGKIILESTCWEDNRVFVELGLPIIRPHYWREDFDMEAFIASLGG